MQDPALQTSLWQRFRLADAKGLDRPPDVLATATHCFAGHILGIREVDDQIWLVSSSTMIQGVFDAHEGRVEPAQNPFAPEKV